MPAPGATATVTAFAVGLAGLGSLTLMEERAVEEARSKLQIAWLSDSDTPAPSWDEQQTKALALQVHELELEAEAAVIRSAGEEAIHVDDGLEDDDAYLEQRSRVAEILPFNSHQAFLFLFVLDLIIAFMGWHFARDCITKRIRRHLPHRVSAQRCQKFDADQDQPEQLIKAAALDGDVHTEEAEDQVVEQAEHDANDQQAQGSCSVVHTAGEDNALKPPDLTHSRDEALRRLTPRDSEEIAKKYVAGLIESALGYPVNVDDLPDADASSTFSFGVEDSGDGTDEVLLAGQADCAPPSRTVGDCPTPRWSTEVDVAALELPEPEVAAPCIFPESDIDTLKTDLHLQFAKAVTAEEAPEQLQPSHSDANTANQQDVATASTDSHSPVEQKVRKDLFVPAGKVFRSAARGAALLDVPSPCRRYRHREVEFLATPLRKQGRRRRAAESPYTQPSAPASSPAVKIERRSPATVPRQFRTEGKRQGGA